MASPHMSAIDDSDAMLIPQPAKDRCWQETVDAYELNVPPETVDAYEVENARPETVNAYVMKRARPKTVGKQRNATTGQRPLRLELKPRHRCVYQMLLRAKINLLKYVTPEKQRST